MPDLTDTQTAEIATLAALLAEDYTDWLDTDDPECEGWKTVEVINGENRDWTRTVEVVTRGPSGQHYSWEYEEGLSEDHPDFGPCERGDPAITPVYPADRTVVVRTWEVTPAQQGERLRIIDRALWVDHGDGNLDALTGELPIWADEWAARIVDAVTEQETGRA